MAAVRPPAAPAAPVDPAVGALLALAGVEHLGPGGVRALVDRYGGAVAALAAGPGDHAGRSDRQRAGVAAVLSGRSPDLVAEERAAAAEAGLARGDRLLGYGQPGYPARLHRLHFPPPVLWARGPLPADAPRTVAIVGTRTATPSARALAGEIAADLAGRGVRVVSGLAVGIDGAAHRGAFEVDGETAAVLGHGLRYRYPSANHDLYRRLRRDGLLLTEFPPDVRPQAHHFPRRNRIVAALSDAVVVVQAGRRSGALLTAGEAAEIGVEVLACPGDPRLAGSEGCHGLLRDGAVLATSAADVLAALGWSDGAGDPGAGVPSREPAASPLTAAERALVERLEKRSAALDELADAADGIGPAVALLTRLEIAGEIRGLPGGRYERIRPRPATATPGDAAAPATSSA